MDLNQYNQILMIDELYSTAIRQAWVWSLIGQLQTNSFATDNQLGTLRQYSLRFGKEPAHWPGTPQRNLTQGMCPYCDNMYTLKRDANDTM
jgi:hypothetical protein